MLWFYKKKKEEEEESIANFYLIWLRYIYNATFSFLISHIINIPIYNVRFI
jgi:hypothetical protein